MSQVISFAEESCWNGEDFRHIRRKVVFKVFSIGKKLGPKFEQEFTADYGLWWDGEDEVLLYHLEGLSLPVNWRGMIFHKKLDQSGIDVYDADTDRLVARIEVRRYEGRKLTEDLTDLGPNVTMLAEWRRKRDEVARVEIGKDPSGEIPSGENDNG